MVTNHDQGCRANRKILAFATTTLGSERRVLAVVLGDRTPPMPSSNEKEKSFDWLTWAIGFLCGITTTLAVVWNFSPH
jgi:hypothetical protein